MTPNNRWVYDMAMGRVFKRGRSWGVDYFTTEGVRKREMVGPSKAIAQKILQKRLTLVAENKHLDIKREHKIKFKDFAPEYLDRHCKRTLRGWNKSSRSNIRHLVNFLGNKFLHEIIQRDVENFIDWRLQHCNPRSRKPIAPNTVNKDLGVLRNMFNKAQEWEYFSGRNPVQGLKFLPVDNKRTRFLEKEEIRRLLENCDKHLKDIVEFALNTGMRKGEIFNLKWHDIDFNRGLVHILKTKNGEKREIPMNEAVRDILYRVRKNPDSPYVFASFNGKPFNDIKKSFYTALNKAEIENFRFHDLRHTFASQLVMAGVDLMTVKELLGHKTIEMTLRYSHLSCYHKHRAVQALNLLGSPKSGTNMAQSTLSDIKNADISNTCNLLASV